MQHILLLLLYLNHKTISLNFRWEKYKKNYPPDKIKSNAHKISAPITKYHIQIKI